MKNFKGPWVVHTVKCVDRDSWVREIINIDGDCIVELSVNPTEKPLMNDNESLIASAPELLNALESICNEVTTLNFNQLCLIKNAIRKARGEK